MVDETAPDDSGDDVAEALEELLSDFGAMIGEPEARRQLLRRLKHGARVTTGDVAVLRWYFEDVAKGDKMNHMGGFVVSRLRTTEAALDTIKGARRFKDKSDKRTAKASESGGENMHLQTGPSESWKQWARGLVRWHLDKGGADEHVTAKEFDIDAGRVHLLCVQEWDAVMQAAQSKPELMDYAKRCKAEAEPFKEGHR